MNLLLRVSCLSLALALPACSLLDGSGHAPPNDLGPTSDLGLDGDVCPRSPLIEGLPIVPCGYANGYPYYTFYDGCNSCVCTADGDGGSSNCTQRLCSLPDAGPAPEVFCEVTSPIATGTQVGALYCDGFGRLLDTSCANLPPTDGGPLACLTGHESQVCGVDANGPYFGHYARSVCQTCVCTVPAAGTGDGSIQQDCTGDFLPGCPDGGGSLGDGGTDGGFDVTSPYCMMPGSFGLVSAGHSSGEWFCDAEGKLRLVACVGP